MSRQPLRDPQTIHRSAVVAVDKLAVPATPTSVTDVATGGSLAFNTAYNITVAAGNNFGPTTCPTVGTVTTANDAAGTHVVRATLAQVTGATYYDIFMSTGAAPLWVARITETQRAAGCTVTAVGTVSATTPGAGKIDVRVVGTGLASNVAPFSVNNAYVTSGITPIDCSGYTTLLYYVQLSVTDLRSIPTLQLSLMSAPVGNAGSYAQFSNLNATILTGVRSPLYQSFAVAINGASQVMILVDTLTGQGASVDIWADLV